MTRGGWGRALRAGLAAWMLPCALTSQPQPGAVPVREIRFEPELQPIPLPELLRLLAFADGAPADATLARRVIEVLARTNRFDGIEVEAQSDVLLIRTTTNWFIGRVEVTGAPDPPTTGQILNASKLELGREFSEGGLNQALEGINASLRANGLYEAVIRPEVHRDPRSGSVDVRFYITAGPRASFSMPQFRGTLPKGPDPFVRASGWSRWWGFLGWKAVSESRVQSGLDRMRRLLEKKDFLLARVNLEGMPYDAPGHRVIPRLAIDPGPRIDVRTAGARFSDSRLRQLLPVYQERAVEPSLLLEGSRVLARSLQNEGWFDAQVDYTDTLEKDRRLIEYRIDRGERYKFVALAITGNRYFDTATLRERMQIHPATRLRYRRGRFSEQLLAQDRAAIEQLYRSNGFLNVKVDPAFEDNYRSRRLEQALTLRIVEGPQTTVRAVSLAGVTPAHEPAVRALIQALPDQPFSEQAVFTDRDVILNYYFREGYPLVAFDWSFRETEPARVELTYTIREGPRQFVRDVLVGGLERTRFDLVRRRLLMKPGDPLSLVSMLETQRRLNDLGIFARVDMAIQNPDGEESAKNLIYQLENASRWSVNIGVGAEIARIGGSITSFDAPAGGAGFSPRLSLSVNRLNFLGRGHTAGLQGRVSNIQQRLLASYLLPQISGNENFNLLVTGLLDNSNNVRTFSARRREAAVQLSQRFTRSNNVQYRYTFRRVSLDENTIKIEPGLIPILARPIRLGIVSSTFIRDRRDDPIDTFQGSYSTIDTGMALRALGSESDFLRLLARNSTYHRLGRDLVLARNLTFGLQYALNRPSLGLDVPLPERFFSGGANSHRGFPENQAGPRDLTTGFPVGGKGLLMFNTELRFPVWTDSLKAVLFHDAGNVYSTLSKISFRVAQQDLRDFDYMVHAVGLGFRYKTPVGPVRVDLAWSPNSPRFFGFEGTREELIFGQGRRVLTRINQFQFHISLGQAF